MMILSVVAVTGLENVAEHLHSCSGHFTQVSKLWSVGLLFLFVI